MNCSSSFGHYVNTSALTKLNDNYPLQYLEIQPKKDRR